MKREISTEQIEWTEQKIESLRQHAKDTSSSIAVWELQFAGAVLNISFDTKQILILVKGNQSPAEAGHMNSVLDGFRHFNFEIVNITKIPSANSTTEILEIRKSSLEISKSNRPELLEQLRTQMNWNFSANPELNDLMTERMLILRGMKNQLDNDESMWQDKLRSVESKIAKHVRENKS